MAERSTAAVDVADNSGDKPLAAKAAKATADGAAETQQSGTARQDTDKPTPEAEGERKGTATTAAPELHSGHKLARRYRLEECVTRLDGFSSWRAMDEKLRRAVGVHLLPADHPRARSVLAAARSSALLGDPRFVQVLDAVEENDLVYVVHEWLPDATELTAILAAGPLEAHEAYQLVNQVSQAMTAAHREGLAHLRLTPSAILRTSTGQYRIRGLAVNAALRGITSERPQRTDTEAIGALLYAALTQRWPYENDAHGLTGLPKGVGLIAPDQVRAGVHRGLGELAMRALANDGATASRQEPACTTPEELAKAVTAMPRIRPPEPAFTAPPDYQHTTYQQGSYGRPQPHPAVAQPVATPPAPCRAAPEGPSSGASPRCSSPRSASAAGSSRTPSSTGSTPTAASSRPNARKPTTPRRRRNPASPRPRRRLRLRPRRRRDKREVQRQCVRRRHRIRLGHPRYEDFANFGNLTARKDGSGLVIDLGSVKNVSGLDIDLYAAGQTAEVLAAAPDASSPSSLADFPQRLTKLESVGKKLKTDLEKPVRTRYVLIHITELPSDGSADGYRGGISEIHVLG